MCSSDLTGHRSGGVVERAIAAGAVAHVLKPFGVAHLVGTITGALADRITRDETEHRHHLHMIERMLRDGYSEREICEALPGGRASRGNGLGSLGALLGWVRARFGS